MTGNHRKNRRSERGVTAIEAAIAFSIAGTVLAVAVPAFVRELHASRFAEPVEGLQRIGANAMAYAHDRPPTEAFPATAPLTPGPPPRATRVADLPGTWDHPTWQALKFTPVAEGVPHSFAFAFDSTRAPGRSGFVAHAHGDLNGNGVTSTFEIRGHASTDEAPTLEPGMYVESEVE